MAESQGVSKSTGQPLLNLFPVAGAHRQGADRSGHGARYPNPP